MNRNGESLRQKILNGPLATLDGEDILDSDAAGKLSEILWNWFNVHGRSIARGRGVLKDSDLDDLQQAFWIKMRNYYRGKTARTVLEHFPNDHVRPAFVVCAVRTTASDLRNRLSNHDRRKVPMMLSPPDSSERENLDRTLPAALENDLSAELELKWSIEELMIIVEDVLDELRSKPSPQRKRSAPRLVALIEEISGAAVRGEPLPTNRELMQVLDYPHTSSVSHDRKATYALMREAARRRGVCVG